MNSFQFLQTLFKCKLPVMLKFKSYRFRLGQFVIKSKIKLPTHLFDGNFTSPVNQTLDPCKKHVKKICKIEYLKFLFINFPLCSTNIYVDNTTV